jgi:hypothetical protein
MVKPRAAMSRINKAYATLWRQHLQRLGATRPDDGVRWLFARASTIPESGVLSRPRALVQVHRQLAVRTRAFLARGASPGVGATTACPQATSFLCDAGLGGLARWLRAAGHDSRWGPDFDDAELVRRATAEDRILLTTDSLLLERRPVRRGHIRVLWLPPVLRVFEQLELVFAAFDLELREPRCMTCGGVLEPVAKDVVLDRIPPRTRAWLERYFVCTLCQRLFWRGTHRQRIASRLDQVASATRPAASPFQAGSSRPAC